MKKANSPNTQHSWSHRKKVWFAIAIATFIIAVMVGVINIINTPRDLGEKLIFVKKINTGCEWWEFPIYLAFCRWPNYDYYFATDMSKEELSQYFKGAELKHYPSRRGGVSSTYTYDRMYFKVGKEEFGLYYYNEIQAVKDIKKLQTDKKHIISMSEESYQLAKEASVVQ